MIHNLITSSHKLASLMMIAKSHILRRPRLAMVEKWSKLSQNPYFHISPLELKTRGAVIFHLDYSEKTFQDHTTLVFFNNSFKDGSHDPLFGSDFYSNSKKLLTRINISMSCNNARGKIGSCEPALTQS